MNGKNTNSTEPHSGARLGLISVFGSTFFQLVGYFMLLPLLLLRLKGAEVSTTVAGLFAATGWLVHQALGTWWIVPAVFLHGAILATLFAPLHETSHGTALVITPKVPSLPTIKRVRS